MKINGKKPEGPSREILVLPRATSEDIVFIAQSVPDLTEFNTLVPEPKPKPILRKGGWMDNVDDPAYQEAIGKRTELRFAWLCLKSLEPSNIEWDTVVMETPSTWLNWTKDLMEEGFSDTEVQRIIVCVTTANCLNEEKLESARESFLAGLAKESEKSCGRPSEPSDTPSGEPANDLASDRQE